eukprot:6470225-Amphidinium_carterae.1
MDGVVQALCSCESSFSEDPNGKATNSTSILAGWSTLSLLTQWFDPFVFHPDGLKFMATKCAVEDNASELPEASLESDAED